ncbi:RND transporter [Myxococcota bacterium]|nr:RND transporter [Myxococcota bacterium]
MEWLDRIPLGPLAVGALLLGLAPFTPEPHLVEKARMLAQGTLRRPIDVFDLFFHLSLPALLLAKVARMALSR